jgi:cytochrome c heme-lyase
VVVEECPVKYKNAKQYNVRGEVIDSKNQMPALAQQKPAPGQLAKLSTERVPSTIPKGGTDNDTWQYPSPQQFWNALVRKGKTEGAEEEAIDAVIAIHNNMNENTWRQVLAWEAMHPVTRPGGEPKLLRFQGRPDELSPKARLKILFGHPAPFDRHDWVVDRGGTEVRYVIDYYHDESGVGQDARPLGLEDSKSIRSIKVDVRPALDSFTSVADRVLRMPLQQARGATAFQPPPFFPPKAMVEAEKGRGAVIAEQWGRIQASCAADKELLKGCKSEDECGAATVKLQRCTAGVVCPDIVSAFDKCAASRASDAETGKAYTHLVRCLELFEIESRNELSKGR